jgi:hypothetical protein
MLVLVIIIRKEYRAGGNDAICPLCITNSISKVNSKVMLLVIIIRKEYRAGGNDAICPLC